MAQNKITGLVISAGLSRRMGQFKPLISFDEKPFLIHIIQKLTAICQNIVIVTGHKSEYLKNEITDWLEKNNKTLIGKIDWTNNPDFEKGMLTSLQKGLQEHKDSDWILYHFVDQPAIQKRFYEEFSGHIDENFDWIQPQYKGQSGHPILISKKLIPKILKLDTNQSLRDIVKDEKLKRKLWNCTYREILHDYDTPQQLKRLTDKI